MTASPAPLHLWRNLTMRVLVHMLENGASQEMCLTHKGIGSNLPRHALSAALKDLKDLGFVFFAKGLWGEDGEMAGAGHGLTAKGMKAAQIILARDARLKTAGPLTDDGVMIAGTVADAIGQVKP